MNERTQRAIFFGVFTLIFLIYFSIYGMHALGSSDVAGRVMALIVSTAPIVLKDLSLLGELTPAVLAGVMAATVPTRNNGYLLLLSFGLAVISYGLYLHLSVFFNDPAVVTILQINDIAPDDGVPVLSSFAGGVRTFSIVIAASLLGLRMNMTRAVTND